MLNGVKMREVVPRFEHDVFNAQVKFGMFNYFATDEADERSP